jgi:hypothetical protein
MPNAQTNHPLRGLDRERGTLHQLAKKLFYSFSQRVTEQSHTYSA